ncbi:MAG: GntR family transcriptional regulator [Pseudomonadota bacterium]
MSLRENFQPLYRQVYDVLTQRLVSGYWKPADVLPSEFALADELGVSQGTVRKALNEMVSEKLLHRRQGKGTYVSEHTQESSLYRFFRLRRRNGEGLIPETRVIGSRRRKATRAECTSLDTRQELVVELTRQRFLENSPVVVERVIQPLSIFPDIDKVPQIPNSLYTLYQERFGISIATVRDGVRAAALPAKYAKYLNLKPAVPVLLIERASMSIDGRVVELSQAYCSTEEFVYAVEVN